MAYFSDFSFEFSQESADLKIVEDETSINQSIKNILFTIPGEVFFDPLFGSNISKLLFEKMDIVTESLLQNEIYYALENFEPRIEITSITFDAEHDNLTYIVDIEYLILKLNTTGTFSVSLQMQGV